MLANLLDKHHFKQNGTIELTGLQKVINDVESKLNGKPRKKMVFSTKDEGIVFHTVTTGMNANPETGNQKLDLYLKLSYEFDSEGAEVEETIKNYTLSLHIKGVQKNNHHSKHDFGWHQDGIVINKKMKKKFHFIHPYYHFHAGGNAIKGKGPGSLMLLDSPRLPHPPMDIVLAVNFVLCHFFNSQEKKFSDEMEIFNDEDYKQIVIRSAKRFYTRYYKEITDNLTHSKFAPLLP